MGAVADFGGGAGRGAWATAGRVVAAKAAVRTARRRIGLPWNMRVSPTAYERIPTKRTPVRRKNARHDKGLEA
ncbi:hypothetical protein JCM2811A_05080 [Methylorubrum rhodinum]